MSKDKKTYQHSTDAIERKIERHVVDRIDTQRQIFIENLLMSNGIGRMNFETKEKVKVFIDEGNNSRLVNELMRRRGNLKIVSSKK
jgi:hypothetical protein